VDGFAPVRPTAVAAKQRGAHCETRIRYAVAAVLDETAGDEGAGRPLALRLLAAGETFVDVPVKPAAPVRGRAPLRRGRQTDRSAWAILGIGRVAGDRIAERASYRVA
jgi:hypothetical protein